MSRFLGQLIAHTRKKPDKWALDPARVDPRWSRAWDHACVVAPCWAQNFGATVGGDTGGREYVSKSPIQAGVATHPEWKHNEFGIHRSCSLGAFEDVLPDLSVAHNEPIDAVTVLFIRQVHDGITRKTTAFGIETQAASTLNVQLPWEDDIVYWDFGGAGVNRCTWARAKDGNKPIDYYAFTGGLDGSKIYFNGDLKATSVGDAPRTPTADPLWLNQGAGSLGADGQNVYLFCMFNNQWTDAQVAEWYADPYGLIREAYPAYKSRSYSIQAQAQAGQSPIVTRYRTRGRVNCALS